MAHYCTIRLGSQPIDEITVFGYSRLKSKGENDENQEIGILLRFCSQSGQRVTKWGSR